MHMGAPRYMLKALGSAPKVKAKAHPHAMGHTIQWEEKAQDQVLAAVEQDAVALQFHEQMRRSAFSQLATTERGGEAGSPGTMSY